MIKTNQGKRIDTVFVLIIFCVFAISVLMVLILGAGIYRNMTGISREGRDERTVLSYIWTKVKSNDKAECVYIGDFHGLSALCFDEVFDEITYRTVVYHYDGWVYELAYETSLDFMPENGERIMEIQYLSFENLGDGLMRVSSGINSLLISQRGKLSGSGSDAVLSEGGLSG